MRADADEARRGCRMRLPGSSLPRGETRGGAGFFRDSALARPGLQGREASPPRIRCQRAVSEAARSADIENRLTASATPWRRFPRARPRHPHGPRAPRPSSTPTFSATARAEWQLARHDMSRRPQIASVEHLVGRGSRRAPSLLAHEARRTLRQGG
jgi:hypothetical protein